MRRLTIAFCILGERYFSVSGLSAVKDVFEEQNLSDQEVEAIEKYHCVQFGEQHYHDYARLRFNLSHDKVAQLYHKRADKDENGGYFQAFCRHILYKLIDRSASKESYRHQDDERYNHEIECTKEWKYLIDIHLHGTVCVGSGVLIRTLRAWICHLTFFIILFYEFH